ncbi:MAG: repeat protein [Fibrobacteres bacterium]|nr:repeat protein [Fibrobacterota bacterium]
MRIPILPGFLAFCLGLSSSCFSANTLGRVYSFGFSKGNLVRNWSFEDRGNNWFDEETVRSRFAAKDDGIVAVTGSFVARFAGSNNTAETIDKLISDVFPIESNSTYTLSFYANTSGTSANVHPVVRFYSDPGQTQLIPAPGQNYPADADWTLQSTTFSTPAGAAYARLALVEVAPTEGGTIYFDDVILEKGATASSRSNVVEAVGFVNDLEQTVQSQLKVSGGGTDGPGRKYLVEASTFDDSRRPVENYEPFTRAGSPDYDPDFDLHSKVYNDGSNGRGDLGTTPFSTLSYFDQPGSQVKSANAPGAAWQGAAKAIRSDWYYVTDMAVPAYTDVEALANDNLSHPYRLDWGKDVNGNYDLAWTNEKGETVQRAFRTSSRSVVTKFEYFPDGRLKKVLTPLDDQADETHQNFREILNYNSAGEVTSAYSKDRGLRKFWYNRLGQVRFSQHESQDPNTFDYEDYDFRDRPISSGTQVITGFADYMEDSRSIPSTIKREHKGFIYDNLDSFLARTGLDLSVLMPGRTLGINGNGRIVCAYHLNNEVDLPALSTSDRIVATFFNYNAYGEVSEAYKYVGPIKNASKKIHKAVYAYDQLHRIQDIGFFDGHSETSPIAEHAFTYDLFGRIIRIAGKQDKDVARYEYYDWGGLKSVIVGGDAHFGTGTKIEFAYHSQGWMKEIKATRLATGETTFQELLGYEAKSYDDVNVPALNQTAFDGKITQQLYKFARDVNTTGPVRLFNYSYDDMDRMTEADFRKSTAPSLLNPLQQINYNNLVWDPDDESMDSRLAYDDVGRIVNNRSGVPAADQAVYHYKDQENSYQLDHVNGKLSGAPSRNTAPAGTFEFDSRGRMSRDESKKMSIAYGWDDMPTRYEMDQGDGTKTSEYEFYDASGHRVSRMDFSSPFQQGEKVLFVGNLESGEAGNPYAYSSLDQAYATIKALLQSGGMANVSQIHLFVVPNANEDEITPTSDIETLTNNSGQTVTLELEGLIKFSAQYYDMMTQYQSGTLVAATHDINLVAEGDEQWQESFNSDGTIATELEIRGVMGRRGQKIGRIVPGGDYEFYLKNHLGSTMRVVSDEGDYQPNSTWVLDYMAYGDLRKVKTGATDVAETFTGKQLEQTTGLYAFGARWMDPQLGMFLNPDPDFEYSNPYSYTGGNPVNLVDPDGRSDGGGCDANCDGGGGGHFGGPGGPSYSSGYGGPGGQDGPRGPGGETILGYDSYTGLGVYINSGGASMAGQQVGADFSDVYSGDGGGSHGGGYNRDGQGGEAGKGASAISPPGGSLGPSGSWSKGLSAGLPPAPGPLYLFPKSNGTKERGAEKEESAGLLSKTGWGIGIAGTGAGAHEYRFLINGTWRASNGQMYSLKFHGNRSVSGYAKALETAERAHAIGRGLFIAGSALATVRMAHGIYAGDIDEEASAATDAAIGYYAYAGGWPGLAFGAIYTGLDMMGYLKPSNAPAREHENPFFAPDNVRIGY